MAMVMLYVVHLVNCLFSPSLPHGENEPLKKVYKTFGEFKANFPPTNYGGIVGSSPPLIKCFEIEC